MFSCIKNIHRVAKKGSPYIKKYSMCLQKKFSLYYKNAQCIFINCSSLKKSINVWNKIVFMCSIIFHVLKVCSYFGNFYFKLLK